MSDPATFHTALANETATGQLMADLALLLGAGDVITLSGDLGAGKTAAALPDRPACGDRLVELAQPGDLIVIMGARDDTLSEFAADVLKRVGEKEF